MTSQHSVQQLSLMLTCFNKARRRCLGDTVKHGQCELHEQMKGSGSAPRGRARRRRVALLTGRCSPGQDDLFTGLQRSKVIEGAELGRRWVTERLGPKVELTLLV